jgi:2-desacetyl-2-hydroxyethyl bacteriochlorophyllide A dehydrogenase
MLQVVLEEPGRFATREVARPEPGPDEALVRVRRIGICGTDLHAYAGRQPFFSYPRVLGHELAVTVERAPAGDPRVQAGDLCTVRPFLNDPDSRASQRGRPNCCERLRVLGVHVDGGMGEWLTIETRFLHPVNELSKEAAALIEPLGIGCHAVARARVTPEDRTLVVGAGPIGLATASFAALAGAPLTVADLSEPRRERVASLLPDATVVGTVDDLDTFDCVFDATGHAGSMMTAFGRVASGGRLVFVGLTRDPITFDDPEFHRRELTLLASRNATAVDFERVIGAVRGGRIDPVGWITHRLALRDLPERFDALRRDPGLVKAVVDVDA